jgi:hypothetical protein
MDSISTDAPNHKLKELFKIVHLFWKHADIYFSCQYSLDNTGNSIYIVLGFVSNLEMI